MKENRPKRRKDRDNPYTISKENDHYYIEFMKGTYEVCRIVKDYMKNLIPLSCRICRI